MQCKNCHTVLEEGVTLCPNCGTENAVAAEPVKAEKTGLGAGKIALLVVLAVAAIAVIIALSLGGGSEAPRDAGYRHRRSAHCPRRRQPRRCDLQGYLLRHR